MSNTSPNSTSTALIPYRADQGIYNRTRYLPDYAGEMLTYFATAIAAVMRTWEEKHERELVRVEGQGLVPVKASQKGTVRAITGDLPTFERFANSIGITVITLRKWAARFPEFAEAYQRCVELQKDFLVQGMLAGRMPPQAAIFVAKNLTDMRDDSTLTVQAAPTRDKPVLADKSKAELMALKELVEKSQALGFAVTIDVADKSDPDGAEDEWAESGIGRGDERATEGARTR